MQQSRSDYTLPHISINKKLPSVMQDALTEALSESIFDRFYTKPELQRVIGTIGRSKNKIDTDQIAELSVYDQAFQLQPIINNTASTVAQITTYKDLLRSYEQIGIDSSDVKFWQSTDSFNYAPPINIDKLLNYNEYYWVGNTKPQYIVIESLFVKLQTKLTQMVKNYVDTGFSVTLWDEIKLTLDTINTVTTSIQKITIKDLDVVLNDTKHPPYRFEPIVSTEQYDNQSDWALNNHWYHRSEISDLAAVKQAQAPIIEYNNSVQLTEWTHTKMLWKYRSSAAYPWTVSEVGPSQDELFTRYPITAVSATNDSFTITGDLTSTFVPGFQFIIQGSTVFGNTWTVRSSSYVGGYTVINVTGNVISDIPQGEIVPFVKTSKGDKWTALNDHWLFVGADNAHPSTAPLEFSIKANDKVTAIASTGQTVFTTDNFQLIGNNVARVYVNGRRQYGTYTEEPIYKIRFQQGLQAGDVVTIYPYASAKQDMGRELVRVRVSEDDTVPAEYKCLVEYRKQEQLQNHVNQYPLFDIVTIDGKTTFTSSSLFEFAEDSSAPVHPVIGKRIVVDSLTNDYSYHTSLVANDGTLFFYKDSTAGICSIWRKDNTGNKYIPAKVDKNRVVNETDPASVFEIPQPFINNVHHDVRNTLKHSELFTHFKSIEDHQYPVDVALYGSQLSAAGNYRLTNNINYGVGGTIKEYNYGFDRLVSTTISTDHSVLDIIDFAENQYAEMLVNLREYIESKISAVLVSPNTNTLDDIMNHLVDNFLIDMSNDTHLTKIFGDSSASLSNSIQNWVGTLPYFGFSKKRVPTILQDSRLGLLSLVHHDGHSLLAELNSITTTNAKKQIIKSLNLYPNGIQQNKPSRPVTGQLWYDSILDSIYRYDVAYIGDVPPVNEFSNGAYWENTSVIPHTMYKNVHGIWELTSKSTSEMWNVIDINTIIVDALLRVETKLYKGCSPDNTNVQQLLVDLQYDPKFIANLQIEFDNYCKINKIADQYSGNYNAADPFTWNYSTLNIHGITGVASWTDLYKQLYNTEFPHLQPWKIQGYDEQPDWWSQLYSGTNRKWTEQMWSNIHNGIVPFGKLTPSGVISDGVTTNMVRAVPATSVNTTSVATPDGIEPDGLFPPYWVSSNGVTNDQVLLSPTIGSADDLHIINNTKSNTFPFGTNGPIEYLWKNSIDYQYSCLRAWFKMDPVRFLHFTFGDKLQQVNGLFIDTMYNKVPSHTSTVFHGDSDSNGNVRHFDGVNQWYAQFFRSNALDLDGSEFKRAWNTWNTQLGYDVGAFLVDKTLSIDSPLFEITPNDYQIAVKRAARVSSIWADALYLSVYQQGSRREMPLGSGRDWKFLLDTASPIPRQYQYYGVKKYRTLANSSNNVFTLAEGSLSLANWNTGDAIVFDLGVNGILPDAVDNLNYYFIIKVSDTTFMIASSKENANLGINIPIVTTGSGIFYVAELQSTYFALDAKNTSVLWKHFVINKHDIKTFNSTIIITGLQNVADVVDGYSAYMEDQGFVFNDPSVQEYDSTNNRIMNWQYVLENTIDTLYKITGAFDTVTTSTAKFNIGKLPLNPFSNNLWVAHPTGVVSEFNGSDVRDIATHAMVYDSNGNKINNRQFIALRKDQITQISIVGNGSDTTQTVDINNVSINPLGFSGAHVYFDEYDQVILFNPYTISGSLIYDSFLGIAIPKVHAYFEKQSLVTKRPNVGGFLLKDGKLQQNYEYTVSNIQKYYDTFTVNENADFVNYARAALGYTAKASYLAGTSATPKSRFLFYKGMIKAKGTTGSVQAFTNNRHFQSSVVDEFWAYRSYDFGDSRVNDSYTLALYPEDTVRSHLKLQFVLDSNAPVEQYFTKIQPNDTARWIDHPTQVDKLGRISTMLKLKVRETFTVVPFEVTMNGIKTKVFQHPLADDIAIYQNILPHKITTYAGSGSISLDVPYLREAQAIDVFKNGILIKNTVDYVEVTESSLQLIGSFRSSDVIVVVWKNAILREGMHYIRINSRLVKLLINNTQHLTVCTFEPNYGTFAPIKIYDNKSNTTICDIMPWDPIKGLHQTAVQLVVDIFRSWDPADYNNVPNAKDVTDFWNTPEVGTVWVDESSYQYNQYTDKNLSTNDKLLNWGTVSQWSDPAVYQWTESLVPPNNWDSTIGVDGVSGTTYKVVYRRDRPQYAVTTNANIFTTKTKHNFVAGQEVSFVTEGTLPSPLRLSTMYIVDTVSDFSMSLLDMDGNPVVTTDMGNGEHIVFASRYSQQWYRVQRHIEKYEALVVDFKLSQLTVTLPAYDEYVMYVDGKFAQDGVVPANRGLLLEPETIALIDKNPELSTITVMNKLHMFDDSSNVVPTDIDMTGSRYQEYVNTPSSVINYVDERTGITTPKYYFWVRHKNEFVKKGSNITTTQIERMLVSNDSPFMLCLLPTGNISKTYQQLVVAGITGIVSDVSRYVMRLIDNQILRNTIRDNSGSILKPIYSEWVMFRSMQNQTIDRLLWNLVMESILGYSLLDDTIAIPSLDRIVYDNINGTNTRYGMDSGQAFVAGPAALETILSLINNPEIDYSPIDVDYFIETHDLSNKDSLRKFLEDMYNTFPAKHINAIFFAIMFDALTNIKVDYSSHLMKTSAISVSGTAPLNVNGEFDE